MLSKREMLENIARANDIHIINGHFSRTKKAACVKTDYNLIIQDKAAYDVQADEDEDLSEEVGHYVTGSLYPFVADYNSPLARSNRMKCEGVARAWKHSFYFPVEDVERAFKSEGAFGIHAVAEYLQGIVEGLEKAIEYHRSMGVAFSFDNVGFDCA